MPKKTTQITTRTAAERRLLTTYRRVPADCRRSLDALAELWRGFTDRISQQMKGGAK